MTNKVLEIGLLGAGGQAEEVGAYTNHKVLFNAVDHQYAQEGLVSIDTAEVERLRTPVVAAVGAPGLKRAFIEKWGGNLFVNIISENAHIDPSASLAEGIIVAPGAVITSNVKIGRHVLVNVAATLSHGSEVGDFTTISPGVNIGGNVNIGRGVFVGIGAKVVNRVSIADGVVVGAGAVVIEDIEDPNTVVVGVPARPIGKREDWLDEI